jgi:hypothetical protein
LFVADEMEVDDDGRGGGAAVVRARGHDDAIPYSEGVLEIPSLFEPNEVEITQTFTLEPGSLALQVTTTIDNDAMEVLNSTDFDDAELLQVDWCSLLDQGQRLRLDCQHRGEPGGRCRHLLGARAGSQLDPGRDGGALRPWLRAAA